MSQVRRLDQIPDAQTVDSADRIALWQDGRTRIATIADAVTAPALSAVAGGLALKADIASLGSAAYSSTTALAAPGNPVGDALAGKLPKTGGTIDGSFALNAPGGSASFNSGYFVVNSRGIYGVAADWLGNSATGGPTNYGYGSFAAGLFLSPIGDVGISAATRTDQITTSGRLPVAGNFQAFNFKTEAPQTAWAIYGEARRKKGGGQIHGLEVNVTDLGDGSDFIVPTAKGSGPQAVFGSWQAGVSIAAGGNIKPGQQTGWDGTQNISQASNCGVGMNIYSNGAQFAKGIIIGENALIGVDGTGGSKTGTAIEMCRGGDIAWIDGTERQGSRIRSDVSPTGAVLTLTFSNFGYLFNGGGANTLQVDSRATDVNGVQILGGAFAGAPARIVGRGDANASLGISASGTGIIQMQSLVTPPKFTVATLPAPTAAIEGALAYVTDASAVTYRAGVAGGGTARVLVFCTGSAWEYH